MGEVADEGPVRQCKGCGIEIPYDAEDDRRAHAEAVELFGRDGNAPGIALVCDECFTKLAHQFDFGRSH